MSHVPAAGPLNSKLMIVGMAPEKNEVLLGTPFVGPSGKLLRDALKAGGFPAEKCFITNVSHQFLQSGVSLFSLPKDILNKEIERLKHEILEVNPNCILALGDEPVKILTGMR